MNDYKIDNMLDFHEKQVIYTTSDNQSKKFKEYLEKILFYFNAIFKKYNEQISTNNITDIQEYLHQFNNFLKENIIILNCAEILNHPVHEVFFQMALNSDLKDISLLSLKIIKQFTQNKDNFLFNLYLKKGHFPQRILSIFQYSSPPEVMIDILYNFSFESDECCQQILNNFPPNIFQIMKNESTSPQYKIHLFYLLYSLSRKIDSENSDLVIPFLECTISIYPFCSIKELSYSLLLARNICTSTKAANIIAKLYTPFIPKEQINLLKKEEKLSSGDIIFDDSDYSEESNDEFFDEEITEPPKYDVIIWTMSELIKCQTQKYIISGLKLAIAFAKIPNPPIINLPIKRIIDLIVSPDDEVAITACQFIEAFVENQVAIKKGQQSSRISLLNVLNFSTILMENITKTKSRIKSVMYKILNKLIKHAPNNILYDLIKNNAVFLLVESLHLEDPKITKKTLKTIMRLQNIHIMDPDGNDTVLSDFQDANGFEIVQSLRDNDDDTIAKMASAFLKRCAEIQSTDN